MPKVSVILNSYNQAAFVRESVESVLSQTLSDYELFIIDNGSTDGTPAILKSYESHPQVRLFLNESNTAVTRRFNEGVAAAKGEYVAFLYSDDLMKPHKLAKQVAEFERLPPDYGVVYCPAEGWNVVTGQRWTYGSVALSGWVLPGLFAVHERGQIDMVSPLTRRRCLVENRFCEDIFAEGEGVFFRIALESRFSYDPEPLAILRDHAGNAGKAIRRNAEMTEAWLMRMLDHKAFNQQLRPAFDQFRATLLRNNGWASVRVGGDVEWARACFIEAAKIDWRVAAHPRTVVGFGLSLVPEAIRSQLNGWVNTLLRIPGNATHVEGFGGADSMSRTPR